MCYLGYSMLFMLFDVCFGGSQYLISCLDYAKKNAIFFPTVSLFIRGVEKRKAPNSRRTISTFCTVGPNGKPSFTVPWTSAKLCWDSSWWLVDPEDLRVVGLVVLLFFVGLLTLKTLEKDRSEIGTVGKRGFLKSHNSESSGVCLLQESVRVFLMKDHQRWMLKVMHPNHLANSCKIKMVGETLHPYHEQTDLRFNLGKLSQLKNLKEATRPRP